MTLVLISGLLSNKRLWGASFPDAIFFSPTEDTPEAMVQNILKEAPPTFALAGHSMGGWLALEIMRQAPSRVAKLCLLNTTSRPDTPEKRALREQLIAQVESGHFLDVVEWVLEFFVFNPAARPQVKEMFLEVGPEVFIRQQRSILMRDAQLPKITCPTLIIHASEDRAFTLEEHQELQRGIPNSRLEVVKNSGHMSPMEAPQAVTKLLQGWLVTTSK